MVRVNTHTYPNLHKLFQTLKKHTFFLLSLIINLYFHFFQKLYKYIFFYCYYKTIIKRMMGFLGMNIIDTPFQIIL